MYAYAFACACAYAYVYMHAHKTYLSITHQGLRGNTVRARRETCKRCIWALGDAQLLPGDRTCKLMLLLRQSCLRGNWCWTRFVSLECALTSRLGFTTVLDWHCIFRFQFWDFGIVAIWGRSVVLELVTFWRVDGEPFACHCCAIMCKGLLCCVLGHSGMRLPVFICSTLLDNDMQWCGSGSLLCPMPSVAMLYHAMPCYSMLRFAPLCDAFVTIRCARAN